MYLEHNSETVFERNSAQKAGGAVFIEQRYIPNHLCFFHTAFQNETLLKEVSVKFVNNTAGYAGSGLYGTVTECSTNTIGHKIIDRVFDVTQQPGNSSISSDPYEVCLCDTSGHMNCSIKSYKFPRSVYPGEVFNISAVAVGQMHGVAPAVIIGTVIGSHNVSLLKPREQNQNASKHCTTLTYMLYSTNQQEALELTVEESNPDAISFYYDYRPPSITISLRPCPWGFTLQHNPPYCDCDPQLVRYDISCNINKQTIQRKPPVWIGYYSAQLNNSHLAGAAKCTESDEEECRGVVVHRNCPYDHCKNMIISEQYKRAVSIQSYWHPVRSMPTRAQHCPGKFNVSPLLKPLPSTANSVCTGWTTSYWSFS